VLDVLDTFYDESIPLSERMRLLDGCLKDLRRLSKAASVAVSAAPLKPGQPPGFLERLADIAGQVWHFEVPQPTPPPRLF
jgi:hypothetical protein